MLSIGKNQLTNQTDYSICLNSVKNEISKNLDIKKELKVNLGKQLEKAETKLNEFSETKIQMIYLLKLQHTLVLQVLV